MQWLWSKTRTGGQNIYAGRERSVCKRAKGLSDTLGNVHQKKHGLFVIQGNITTGDVSGRGVTRREWGEGTDRRGQPQPEDPGRSAVAESERNECGENGRVRV